MAWTQYEPETDAERAETVRVAELLRRIVPEKTLRLMEIAAHSRCRHCKWWGERQCGHSKVGGIDRHDRDGVTDVQNFGGIRPGPDWGCIHWEQRA